MTFEEAYAIRTSPRLWAETLAACRDDTDRTIVMDNVGTALLYAYRVATEMTYWRDLSYPLREAAGVGGHDGDNP